MLLAEGVDVDSWDDLRGRPICLTDGAYYNRTLIQRYLFSPQTFKGTRDSALGLENGRCLGWAYDDMALRRMKADDIDRWRNFAMPLSSILVTPWAMAVKSTERDGPWGRFVSDSIVEWHKSGFLIAKEAEWGLPPSAYLKEQQALWGMGDCVRRTDGSFPPACLDQGLLVASGRVADVYGSGIVLALHRMGINFPPLFDEFSRDRLLRGIGWTLLLSVGAIVGSLAFGIGAGWLVAGAPRLLRMVLNGGLSLFYMTPPILNLYLLLFGVGGWLAARYGVALDAAWVALFVFSTYAGSSNAVIVALAVDGVRETHPELSGAGAILPRAIERGYGGADRQLDQHRQGRGHRQRGRCTRGHLRRRFDHRRARDHGGNDEFPDVVLSGADFAVRAGVGPDQGMGGAMGVAAILDTPRLWTPFLAEGFGLNLLISAVSMLAGTVVGLGLGWLRAGDLRSGHVGAGAVTVAFRNIPSFVFMYYIAFMTPVEFAWNGELVLCRPGSRRPSRWPSR